jgi:hypothetical protein
VAEIEPQYVPTKNQAAAQSIATFSMGGGGQVCHLWLSHFIKQSKIEKEGNTSNNTKH